MAKKKFTNRREKPEYDQKLLDLARVTRVVKGGRRFRFRAVLVIGNRNGKVGIGVSKGNDVSEAVRKAYNAARKKIVQIKRHNNTIACNVEAKSGSAKVLLKPAKPGRGIVAGGAVRAIVELSGIRDIVSKSMGSSNKLSVARATIDALERVKSISGRQLAEEQTK
ncbi:MAG: 30S ribosomal protein S5 [Parcubacteria group bacterium]|jgi:small subunit ribosomal protein S5